MTIFVFADKNFFQIPEYCRNIDEKEISENVFQLIFAFDEIIALGYRENVNLGQIKTFTEMDSHDEKVYQAVRQTQEREAKEEMKRKAKELQRQRAEAQRTGKSAYSGGMMKLWFLLILSFSLSLSICLALWPKQITHSKQEQV